MLRLSVPPVFMSFEYLSSVYTIFCIYCTMCIMLMVSPLPPTPLIMSASTPDFHHIHTSVVSLTFVSSSKTLLRSSSAPLPSYACLPPPLPPPPFRARLEKAFIRRSRPIIRSFRCGASERKIMRDRQIGSGIFVHLISPN